MIFEENRNNSANAEDMQNCENEIDVYKEKPVIIVENRSQNSGTSNKNQNEGVVNIEHDKRREKLSREVSELESRGKSSDQRDTRDRSRSQSSKKQDIDCRNDRERENIDNAMEYSRYQTKKGRNSIHSKNIQTGNIRIPRNQIMGNQ